MYTTMKCGFFFLKKRVKFGRMIKSAPSKYAPSLLYIFLIFWAICEYHASKNLLLLLRTIHRAIFSHLCMKQSVAYQVGDTLI